MAAQLLDYPAALCNQVRRIAFEAGELLLDYFDEAGYQDYEVKADNSPVTIADQKAEDYINTALKTILPDIPIVGEEGVAAGTANDIHNGDYFWLVDPLDGTKEFIAGGGEFTVNIGLIYQGRPLMGVVYAPWTGDLYGGYGPGTAFKWHLESDKERPISCRRMPKAGLTVMAGKRNTDAPDLTDYLQQFKINKVIYRGSSLKTCAIAAGKADLHPGFSTTCEWDTAAVHAVLNSAGGFLVHAETGEELTYGHNRNGKWLNPRFIARGFEI